MLTTLTPRSEAILKALIEAYVADGEPVGSRLLAQRSAQGLSAATIRNVLAELEAEAWLDQPHTSAGRTPTQKAYRYYVDRWVRPMPPDPWLQEELAPALPREGLDPEAWLRQASRTLSEVMGAACLVLPHALSRSRLVRLEFVPLGTDRLVAVWVGTGGEVEHQVMGNNWGYTPEQLTELGNFATHRFQGVTLPGLRSRLVAALEDQRERARQLCARLVPLAEGLAPETGGGEPALVVSGLVNLGRTPEFEDAARFRALVETFEEHERLARLMNAFAEAAVDEIQLLLGTENPYLGALSLTTALRTVPLGTGSEATFALVSPLRADFTRMLGGLAWWTDALGASGFRVP